ncbi:MAG: sulfotransferase family 2 domain-containing protein [Leptolyngbyaceae cyanobacterium]
MSYRLFFIHIPKTAGTTFNAFLGQQFPLEKIAQDGVFGKHELFVKRQDLEGRLESLKQFSLFRGHYGYDVFSAFAPEYSTLTVLRHPFQRVVSLYNDWHSKSEESLAKATDLEKSLAALAKQLPLPDFFQAKHPLLPAFFHNGQARLLARDCSCDLEGSALQALAMSHLEQINYVGITEAFDLFLWLLCEHFGWHYPQRFQSLNAARHWLCLEDLDDATLAAIAVKNEVDLALYDRAKELALTTAYQIVQGPFPKKTYINCCGQASITITMADPIPGTGWHVLEGVGSDRLWRWTGPTRETTLFIQLDPTAYDLSVRVISVMDVSTLYQSKIKLNETLISTTVHEASGEFFIKGHISEASVGDRVPTQLTIIVPQTTAPTDVDPAATDSRQKGLAIQSISLQSVQP